MKYLLILLPLLFISCSSKMEYEYVERNIVPDSLKDDLRQDFLSAIDYDNLSLAGDPDHDDDMDLIFRRLRDTYQISVGMLKVRKRNQASNYILEEDLGQRYKVIYDSLKVEYYGH